MATIIKQQHSYGEIVPEGAYLADLLKAEQFENAHGERIGLVFQIAEGEAEGACVNFTAAPKLTRQSKLTLFIQGLLGRELTDHEMLEGFDLDTLAGHRYAIQAKHDKGRTGNQYAEVCRAVPA